MSVTTRGQLRRFWFLVHMWIGVGLFLVLIPISASGSYLVWRDEIDRAMHPARFAVSAAATPQGPSAYLEAAQAAFGDRARVASVRLPANPGDPVTVTGQMGRGGGERGGGERAGRDGGENAGGDRGDRARRNRGDEAGRDTAAGQGHDHGSREASGSAQDAATASPAPPAADAAPPRAQTAEAPARDGANAAAGPRPAAPRARTPTLTAWIDPGSLKVLDVANPREGVSMWMHDLHGQLFVFGVGRQVVGWFGWLMLVSCISGIWLWWPKAGALINGLRWRRGPEVLINLHYTVGFWVAIPLAVLSLSGALISFPPFTRAIVGAFAPLAPQQAGRGPGGPGGGGGAPLRRTDLTADQVAANATGAYPDAKLVSLTLPTRGGGKPAWRAQLRGKDGLPINLQIDDEMTGVVRAQPQAVRPAGEDVIRLNRRIHDGDDTPLLWKWIITIVGLAPALLGVTGVIVWARSQLRKASMRRRIADTPAAEPAL